MLNRFSVNMLLKSVIATLALATITVLALGSWNSWMRLTGINRTVTVVDTSAHLFNALHNIRLDRSLGYRDLVGEAVLTGVNAQVRDARVAGMPALAAGVEGLKSLEFPNKAETVAKLERSLKRLAGFHQETAAAYLAPKASRRPALAKEFMDETTGIIDMLDKVSTQLTDLVKLDDAFIDQLMEIKQLAWIARSAGGDGSVLVSNSIAGMPLPANALVVATTLQVRAETAWAAMEDMARGLAMPSAFRTALAKANGTYFGSAFQELRSKTLTKLLAGEPAGLPVAQWTANSVPNLATLLGVSSAALDAAKDYAQDQRAKATASLLTQLGLLTLSLAFSGAMMFVVSWRVTGPLGKIQDAMVKVTQGDMSADVSFGERRDEIGALAGALQTFKASLVETERLRSQQKDTEVAGAAQRKREMAKLADEFEAAVGQIVATVSSASAQLETAATTLTGTADGTQRLAGVVASASEQASANVQSVASATEQMTVSVNEIARQVEDSSRMASDAVKQAERTDAKISELSSAAGRIGDVVKLITAVAEQTNLLALNATIEAARAGDAGRGFAVVASEVKALAGQTAKATDEIGSQIAMMQTATRDSVGAIKEIGETIGRMSSVATAIAAAIQQQGAATQEIARNVQEAARATSQVAANITDVNRGASDTGSASSEVLGSAKSLARESGALRREVERFVSTVRAA